MKDIMSKHTVNKKYNILIIGGGIGGLSLAHTFIHDKRLNTQIHITLMERKDRYGGRVKTIRVQDNSEGDSDSDSNKQRTDFGWYEAGASRVAQSHNRVRHLANQLKCKELLLPASYDRHRGIQHLHKTFQTIYQKFVNEHSEDGLYCVSWSDVMKMMCPPDIYTTLMREWGFQSVLIEMNAYDFWHYAMPQYLSEKYFTYENGLQSIIDTLVAELEKSSIISLHTNTKVLNIQSIHTSHNISQLNVSYQNDEDVSIYNTKNTNTCHTKKTFDMVCCALPAEAIEEIRGIPQYYSHFWSSVSRNHLIRCYTKYKSTINKQTSTHKQQKTKKRKTSFMKRNIKQLSNANITRSILHKCTTTHSSRWFQLSYCDNTHADHIYNLLRLPKGIQQLRKEVSKTIGKQWANFEDTDIDVHFWRSGTHSWKPQLLSDNHYSRVLQLDSKIPLFVVGSSFSHYQHWMEGALETVHDAYKKMWRFAVEWWNIGTTKKRYITQLSKMSRQQQQLLQTPFYLHNKCNSTTSFTMNDVKKHKYVVLDGYVYDIQPIMDQHPGGRKLLENMLGHDISKPYHRIGHSSTARAWVEQHCKGTLHT